MIKRYLIALGIFLVLDVVWLSLSMKVLYRKNIGELMAEKANFVAAVVFYLIFIGGLVYFVINPALEKESIRYAIISGVIYGLVTYGTYDLTNHATLKDWPLIITVVDMIWGSFLGGSVSTLSYIILSKIGS